ncbi:MAG: hypothetical protein HQM08_28825, partial [Candidatus Riflebacteria bacterium]|nr:hypothetical protein [Candidatus Riflebacteria bacterium]
TLKAMLGANVIMGETLRGHWEGNKFSEYPESSSDQQAVRQKGSESLPSMAQKWGSEFPKEFKSYNYPKELNQDDDDPLVYCDNGEKIKQDDVKDVALKTGVLVRDGGHFEAVFPKDVDAKNFCWEAQDLLARKLSGLIFETRLKELKPQEKDGKTIFVRQNENLLVSENVSIQPFDLPQFEDCQASGIEPAIEKCSH